MLLCAVNVALTALLTPSGSPRGAPRAAVRPSATFGDPLHLQGSTSSQGPHLDPKAAAIGVAALLAAQPDAVFAKGGEFGIFEGRIVSLAHPTVMVCAPLPTFLRLHAAWR